MSTLTDARKATADRIRRGIPREADVKHYDVAAEVEPGSPRVYVEVPNIGYHRSLSPCSRAEIEGRIVIEVDAGTDEDASNIIDEYLDPFSDQSVISVLLAASNEIPPFGGAWDSFVVTDSVRTGPGAAEIPFRASLTRPAV